MICSFYFDYETQGEKFVGTIECPFLPPIGSIYKYDGSSFKVTNIRFTTNDDHEPGEQLVINRIMVTCKEFLDYDRLEVH